MLGRRVAIVTGASRGLGRAVAQRLANNGMEVVTCARSGDVTRHCDVANPQAVEHLIRDTALIYGRIDVLVCNAGVYKGSWREMIYTNFIGTLLCVEATLPIMQQQGYGRIITLSGGGVGGAPVPGLAAYAASKAAVVQYTESLAVDQFINGISINAVAPGPQDTEGQRDSAVDLITFLSNDSSDGITGRLISAFRDDWRSSLMKSKLSPDNYRLRRVVP